jgi:hypothetical protein
MDIDECSLAGWSVLVADELLLAVHAVAASASATTAELSRMADGRYEGMPNQSPTGG